MMYLPKLIGNREQKMCRDKYRHLSDLDAHAEKSRPQQKTGIRMNVYFCPFCHHWHVGRARVPDQVPAGVEA